MSSMSRANKTATKTAVVTGAGSGLGRAICMTLAKRGYALVAADIHLHAAQKTCEDCLSAGASKALALQVDVRSLEEIQNLANQSFSFLGEVGLLVNNAGVAAGGAFDDQPLSDWNWVIDTNLWGVIYGCYVFIPRLKAQGHGHVLNIASAAGLLNPPNLSSYNVAKAGVIALSETLFAELEKTGVGISVVCPTFFKTALLDTARLTRADLRTQADKIFSRSRASAEGIAELAISAVDKNEFYVVPNLDGKLLWQFKRTLPRQFLKLAKRLNDKILMRES